MFLATKNKKYLSITLHPICNSNKTNLTSIMGHMEAYAQERHLHSIRLKWSTTQCSPTSKAIISYSSRNDILFLFSMSSRQPAGCFIPVQVVSDSTVSLKQLCTRYERTTSCMSSSLIVCKMPKRKKYE